VFLLEEFAMKLYYNPLSTYSQKVMIAFHEKGIAYQPEIVDLMSPEGRTAYEKVNPIGKVPFLKPSEDWMVPESTSIIEYLEDKFPNSPRLIPAAGGEAARQVRFMDRMADLYLNDPVVELLFQKFGFRKQDEERAAKARKYIGISYEAFNKRLGTQSWICGENFSMADCAAIPPLFYAQVAAPFDSHPNVVAYWRRAQQRPSYSKVKAEFEPIWNGMLAQRKAA
jgi:glutathione S-transferase